MSTVGTITKLATDVVGKTAHAVTHPVATVTTVAGTAKKVASTVVGGASEKVSEKVKERPQPDVSVSEPDIETPDPKAAAEAAVRAEEARAAEAARAAEPSTTEPKAASRQAAHQGRGEEPTDDWHDELDAGEDINPATGQPHNAPDDEPLLDPSVAKAVRAESETLRKAAEPNKE